MTQYLRVWGGIWLISICAGLIVWQLFDDSAPIAGESSPQFGFGDSDQVHLITVGAHHITLSDVDFEHEILTRVLDEDAPLLESSSVDQSHRQFSWHSLRQFILQTLVKRKALFVMIKKDKSFSFADPELHDQCDKKIQEVVESSREFFSQKDYQIKIESRICESHTIDRYVDELTRNVDVTEQMAKEYYYAHRSNFSSPERIVIRHIQLPSEQEAKLVLRKAKAKMSGFAHLAQKYSIAPESSDGGLLGPFAVHEMPSFLAEVFLLKLGRISPILKSSYGYHIVLPLKKYPSKVATFEEAKDEIVAHLIKDQKKKIYEAWLHRTLNTVPIITSSYLLEGGSI